MKPLLCVSPLLPMAFLVAAAHAAPQQSQALSSTEPRPPLPRQLLNGVHVAVEWSPDGASVLRLRDGATRQDLPLASLRVTAVTAVADALLVGGVGADGLGTLCVVERVAGDWSAAGWAVPMPFFPVSLAHRFGWLGALLADGRVVAAPWLGREEPLDASDFELVGMAGAGTMDMVGLAAVAIEAEDRIDLFVHPAARTRFQRSASGEWQRMGGPEAVRPALRIAGLPRMGNPIVVHLSAVEGPLFLEDESGISTLIPSPASPSGLATTAVLPAEWTATLSADQRYRVRSAQAASSWFHPASITGSSWSASGVELQECRVFEAGVRVERGRIPFRTSVTIAPGNPVERLTMVALVAISSSPAPDIEQRGTRTWLRAQRIATVDAPLLPGSRTRVLVVPVPLLRQPGVSGSWVHGQIAVLDPEGRLLGATGVRSVPVLPDRGAQLSEYELRQRAFAEGFWAQHGVGDAQAFREAFVGQ